MSSGRTAVGFTPSLTSNGTEVLSYSFSPDGKWITFAKTGTSGLPDLFVMRPSGKNIRPVTHSNLWDSAPDWGRAH